VAAGGTFCAWLVHASVDWIYLIPSLTGVALCAAAVLVTEWPPRPAPGSRRGARWLGAAAVGLLIAFAAVEVARPVLALHARTQGRAALARNPTRALSRARDSLSFESAAIEGRYLEAAAYARLGDYARARGALLRALDRQPHDFVTWALLGDLAVRRGDLATARAAYRRARSLNPRDPTLRQLARNPRLALASP
jgi:cytochrome c-type biogenesis protein CcmH/NrfG